MAAIEISGLSKDYQIGFWRKRPWRALDQLSFSVEHGEVFGFLGHNGAGKTTTLKILNGLIFPTAGTATILGNPLGKPETFYHLGYLPENPYFYDYLTAQELLDYFAHFFPMTPADRRRRRDDVLEQVGLEDFRHMPLRKFSKGMLQRLGIAQAVLHSPEIVLLDEPMSGLDPLGRRAVRDLIVQLKAEGKTVFFSTHILSDAEALCDRVAILNRGKLVGVGRISELLKSQSGFEVIVAIPQGASAPKTLSRLQSLAGKPVLASGGHYRVEIGESNVRQLLALCEQGGLRLISLNPVHISLEDYFAEISEAGDKKIESRLGSIAIMKTSPTLAIALNTFREAVRDRVLYNLVAFAVILIASSLLVGQISIGIQKIILINLGLSSISIFGLLIAIFLGIGLVYKEVDKRSLYALLSKPIRRRQFIVGKFLGLNLTLLVNTAFMTLGFWAALYFLTRHFEHSDRFIWPSIYFILLQLFLVTALCLFFSCFSTPILSAIFTFLLYVIGTFASDIRAFGTLTNNASLKAMSSILYYLLPNFSDFNIISSVSHGTPVSASLILLNTLYTFCYSGVLLAASVMVFSRKDLK